MAAKKKTRNSRKTALIAAASRTAALRDSGMVRRAARPSPKAPSAPGEPSPSSFFACFMAAEDVEAMARSSVALANGVQALGRALFDLQRQSVTAGLAAARDLVGARNLQDVMEVQRRYLAGSVESAVKESGGFAELVGRVANEAWGPLAPRIGMAFNRLRYA